MRYNLNNINTDNGFLFFWGHQASKDGAITKTCFSQWWQSSFIVNDIEYKTAEHWMMSKKASLFDDTQILKQILKAKTPADAKLLGRKVRNYNDTLWIAHRFQIVKEANIHKFSQNLDLRAFLLNTGVQTLVEASPVDNIWGIGMAADHKDVYNPEKWQGLNLLGFALMEVRDEFQKQVNNE